MFAIGDKEWPGISKLVEESGELLQVCGKLMGSGGKLQHWDGSNLQERLQEEIADVLAATCFVQEKCQLDGLTIFKRVEEKLARFRAWHEAGDANQKALEE